MKFRSDFVSNSSSSSFILANNVTFDYFKITKEIMVEALTDLTKDVTCFEVYDLNDEKELKKALKDYKWLLKDFKSSYVIKQNGYLVRDPYNCRRIQRLWEDFKQLLDINVWDIRDLDKNTTCMIGGKTQPIPSYILKTIKKIAKENAPASNYDIVKDEISQFFVHFGENELYHMFSKENAKYNNKEQDVDNWHDNVSSNVITILYGWLVAHGYIKVDDEKYINEMIMDDYGDRVAQFKPERLQQIKERYQGIDQQSDVFFTNSVMSFCPHEG